MIHTQLIRYIALLFIITLSGCSDDGSGKAYSDCIEQMEQIGGTVTTRDVEACLKVASAVRAGHKLNKLYEDRVRLMKRQCDKKITMYDEGKAILSAENGIVTDYHLDITLNCATGEIVSH